MQCHRCFCHLPARQVGSNFHHIEQTNNFRKALSTVSAWFSSRRGIAFAILATGSSLGGIIFPIMVDRLIGQVGFGWTMRICAFVILFLLAIANITVRPRLPVQRAATLSQSDLGRPLKEPAFLLTLVGFMLLTYGVFIPINFVIVEAEANGMSTSLAAYMLPMLNAASLFGRLGAGIVSDRLGRYNVFTAMCFVASILVLALWIPAASNAPTIVFATLFGFASGAYVSLAPALIAQISPLSEIGYRMGLLFLSASLGGLTTSPIAGAILANSGGSFTNVKVFSGVFLLAGTALTVAARLAKTGPKLAAKF